VDGGGGAGRGVEKKGEGRGVDRERGAKRGGVIGGPDAFPSESCLLSWKFSVMCRGR